MTGGSRVRAQWTLGDIRNSDSRVFKIELYLTQSVSTKIRMISNYFHLDYWLHLIDISSYLPVFYFPQVALFGFLLDNLSMLQDKYRYFNTMYIMYIMDLKDIAISLEGNKNNLFPCPCISFTIWTKNCISFFIENIFVHDDIHWYFQFLLNSNIVVLQSTMAWL